MVKHAMIGSKDLTYSSAQNGIIRNFRIGWDGSLAGGSTYHWSISADGRAKFKTLSADSGTMYNCTVNSCKIGNCTLSGALTGTQLKITENSIARTDNSVEIKFIEAGQVNISNKLYVQNRIYCADYIETSDFRMGSGKLLRTATSSTQAAGGTYYAISGALLTKLQNLSESSSEE